MQLNKDWKTILRHYSSIALTLISAFSVAWAASPDFQALIPANYAAAINLTLALAGFAGKFIKQNLGTSNG